ncbi:MAG: hypothetical protein JWO38_6544 [Gemmataceae bacterium]|nr:hypothetical protein [Gemmataceae bacterium]
MTAVAHLAALYSAAPIILWVEDPITRDYLTKVWDDPPEISFLIAGGKASVRPTVSAAEQEGISHVFGLADRDFGHSNIANWNAAGTRVFYLPRHEIENYTLDVPAIHGCALHNRGRSVADVATELNRLAMTQPIWLACRRVISDLREEIQGDFPGHPALVAVTTLLLAEQHIVASNWFTQLSVRAATWTRPGYLATKLQDAERAFNAARVNGTWLSEFSGRELFRPLRSYVYQPPRLPGNPDSDFAKAVGEWQQANNAGPADLTQLRSALRIKVGLPP